MAAASAIRRCRLSAVHGHHTHSAHRSTFHSPHRSAHHAAHHSAYHSARHTHVDRGTVAANGHTKHGYVQLPQQEDEDDECDESENIVKHKQEDSGSDTPFGILELDDIQTYKRKLLELDPEQREVVGRLRKSITQNRKRKMKAERRLSQIQQRVELFQLFWKSRAESLEGVVEESGEELSKDVTALRAIVDPDANEDVEHPPGPKCLIFVTGRCFTCIISFVIIANMVTMAMEMLHPNLSPQLEMLNSVYMVFYLTELILRACLLQKSLLIGRISIVFWNWLDLIIVMTGCIEEVAENLPFASMSSSSALAFIRILRLARLPRILKIVRLVVESDLSWAAGDSFQVFMMGVIAFNCLFMAVQADYEGVAVWKYIENALLLLFLFELIVRLKLFGWGFFYQGYDAMWNWMDTIIVVGSLSEAWLMPILTLAQEELGYEVPKNSPSARHELAMLRMARLFRILRLVKLIKNIPPLFTLLVGMVQAMWGMVWVLVLTTILLYSAALLAVKLVGHSMIGNVPEEVRSIFPNVPESMFVLFMAMNGNAGHLNALFEFAPVAKLAFVLYMVVLSWGILSILTAVVSENMINATDAHREEVERAELERLAQGSRDWLGEIFDKMDHQDTGLMDRETFNQMMMNQALAEELSIATGGMHKMDLMTFFDCLCSIHAQEAYIHRDDFIEGLAKHVQDAPVTQREVLRLEKRMAQQEKTMSRMLAILEAGGHSCSAEHSSNTSRIMEPNGHDSTGISGVPAGGALPEVQVAESKAPMEPSWMQKHAGRMSYL